VVASMTTDVLLCWPSKFIVFKLFLIYAAGWKSDGYFDALIMTLDLAI